MEVMGSSQMPFFSCGWLLITGVGQLTGLLGKDFLTRPNVCFVTRNRKAFSTS
jgi:hypothetical protein